MKRKVIILIFLFLSSFFVYSCGGDSSDSTTDSTTLDTETTDGNNATHKSCNYSSTDNKIKPNVEQLSYTGYYKSFAGTRYLTIRNGCYNCQNQPSLKIKDAKIGIIDKTGKFKEDAGGFTIAKNPLKKGVALLGMNAKINFGIDYTVDSWEEEKRVLRIFSDDKCYPELDINLKGDIKDSSRVEIKTLDDSKPDDLLMEFTDVEAESEHRLKIMNIGTLNLFIKSMTITQAKSLNKNDPGFYIKSVISSKTPIKPNNEYNTMIGCRNDKDMPQTLMGELEIRTNDITENGKNLVIKIELQCGPKNEHAPKAVLKCSPKQIAKLAWPVLDGSDSVNSDGITKTGLKYYWDFKQTPAGSGTGGATIVNLEDKTQNVTKVISDASKATFQAILQGSYIVRLMVVDLKGVHSNFAECKIESIPDDDMIIKMIWNNKDSDVDLHLIAPGGSYGDKNTDCYFYNCSPQYDGKRPDWGVAGDTKDDPFLDFDNTSGVGPETVSINKPMNGTYQVIVQTYDLDSGPSKVVVKAYDHAVEAATSETLLTKTGVCWHVFDITVSDGTSGKKKLEVKKIEPVEIKNCKRPPMSF